MQYRRAFVPGGTFFFTLVTADRKPIFAEQKNVAVLREAFRRIRLQRPFELDAVVILPDHLHCIWTLPPGDSDFATRWAPDKDMVYQAMRFKVVGLCSANPTYGSYHKNGGNKNI